MLARLVGHCGLAMGLVACGGGVAFDQPVQPAEPQGVRAAVPGKMSRTPAQQKLDSHLYVAGQAARGLVNSSTLPSLPESLRLLEFDDKGNVHVDIQGTVTPALLWEIAVAGGTVESSFPNDVTFIKSAEQAMTNVPPSTRMRCSLTAWTCR